MPSGPYPGSDSGSSSPGTRAVDMQRRRHDDKLLLHNNITIN